MYNKVLLCGYLVEHKGVKYISSISTYDLKDNPTMSQSRDDFIVRISFLSNYNHPDDFHASIGQRVSAVGYLDANDIKTNKVIITCIKHGFVGEKNIVLIKGNVNSFQIDETAVRSNSLKCRLSDVWFFDIGQKDSDNNLVIYIPKSISALSDYIIKKNCNISLIGYLGFTNKHYHTEHYYTYNSISITNQDKTLCPFMLASQCSLKDMQTFYDLFYLYNIFINKIEYNIKGQLINTISPINIFKDLVDVERANNIYYSKQDIFNFCYAMSDGTLTILSGLSGVGKTNLVKDYAISLDAYNNKQFKHIAVSSNWTSSNDLLGFFNPNNSTYYPSNTGLVDLLQDASHDTSHPYIVLFDEMNLSQIEYYFSEFLSRLEYNSDDPNRCIKLFNDRAINDADKKEKNGVVYSNNKYPSKIHIYNNVLFVGTINNDVSTKNVTDKVLDRSDYIILPTFSRIFKNKKEFIDKFVAFENSTNTLGLTKEELSLLYTLDNDLHSKNCQFGIGWRILKQINSYLSQLPKYDKLPEDLKNSFETPNEYEKIRFDHQLSQRIISKIINNPRIPFQVLLDVNKKLKAYFKDNNQAIKSINLISSKINILKGFGYNE